MRSVQQDKSYGRLTHHAVFTHLPLYLLCLLCLLCLFLNLGLPYPVRAQSDQATLEVEGQARTALVHVPDDLSTPAPLVIVLHGGGGNGPNTQRYTGFNEIADANGFIVVYPDGIDNSWNDGREVNASGVDDVGFIAALIEMLVADYGADPERVFVTGISNGGYMSMRLACELADRVAGAAIVTAGLSEALSATCAPAQPVAMLIMNGTDDPIVPYDGGQVDLSVLGERGERGATLSTDDSIAFWTAFNECADADSAPETALGNAAPLDRTRVYVTTYSDCTAPVVRYRIEGGGHTWPGTRQYLPVGIIGRTSRDIDGSAVIWEFFASLN